MIEEALDYYQDGNYEAAYALYQKMLADEPGNHEVLYMLSMCRQQQSRWQEAISLLNEAIDNNPDNPVYHYALGGLYMRSGDSQRALARYRKASELRPNEPRSRIGVGYALLASNMLEEATAELKAAMRAAEDQPEVKATALAHLGVIALQQAQLHEALGYLQNAAELNPEDVYIQTHLGRAFLASGQAGFAVQCFHNAQGSRDQRYQSEPMLLLWLGQALEQTGDMVGAVNAWRELLQQGVEHPELLFNLARAHLHGRQPQQAINLLLRAKKVSPDVPEISHLLATAWQQTGRQDAARQELEQLPATDRTGQRQLARLYLAQAHYAKAADIAEQLVRDPEDPDLLLAAQVAVTRRQADSAHQYLNQLDQVAQSSIPGTWLRALAYVQDDPDKARQLAQQLLEHDNLPADIKQSALRLQAQALHAQGQYNQAWQSLDALPQQRCQSLDVVTEPGPDGQTSSDDLTLFDRDLILSWPPKPPGRQRMSPVFVLGWPGTARAKLLQALSFHPDIDVIRDRPVQANEAATRYSSTTDRRHLYTWPRDPAQLDQISEADWLLLRNHYRKQAIQSLGSEPGPVVIDSLELPISALIAIQRLFPDATIINLQNDLDDLRLHWRWNGYQDQDELRDVYLHQQRLLKQARHALVLPWVDLLTRQVLEDPQATLTPLLEHFGLQWDDAMAEPLTESLLSPPNGAGKHYKNQ